MSAHAWNRLHRSHRSRQAHRSLTRRATVVLAATALGAAAVLTACSSSSETSTGSGGGGTSSTTAAPTTSGPTTTSTSTAGSIPEVPGQVVIRDYELLPPEITVAAGEPITWQNTDDVDHWMLTDDDTTVDSGTIVGGSSYSTTITTPGTYPYFCDIHNAMTGTIVVE